MMKKTAALLAATALAASAGFTPSGAAAQTAKVPPPAEPSDYSMGVALAAGAGALAGVVGYNLLALGVGALPGGLAYGAGTMVPAEMSVAMSRVFATASAAGGALAADYIYTSGDPAAHQAAAEHSWVSPRLLSAGAGAIVGVTAFNVATAGVAAVPLAGAALAAVPTDVALGSRMLAGLSAGAGALAGVFAYDAVTGEQHDTGYVLALAAGALGGVAAGNLLAGWGGTLPTSAAATASAAQSGAFSSAAAQAASRVHVIASGVVGAWTADAVYGGLQAEVPQ